MVYVSRPILWWSSKDDGSDELTGVLTDKRVWLNEKRVRQVTPFQIKRRNLLTRIPGLGRRLFGSWVTDIRTVYLGGGYMRSETSWQATNVSLVPGIADYFFTDGNGGASGILSVSNTPVVRYRSVRYGGAGLEPKIVGSLSSNGLKTDYARANLFYAKREYEITLEADVLAPRDPLVEIEVLEPSTSQEILLEIASNQLHEAFNTLPVDFLDQGHSIESNPEFYGYDPNQRYFASVMHHIDSFLGRRYVDFQIHGEKRFLVGPDRSVPISVTVRGEGPERLLFAIRVRDVKNRTSAVSEFMPVVVIQPS